MTTLLYTIASVIVVSAASLVGALVLSFQEKRLSTLMHVLVGLAAGALLGDAFVHLIPEAFETGLSGLHFSYAILAGIIAFFVLEKYLRWHHHEHDTPQKSAGTAVQPLGPLVLVGDGVHNFVDGAVIAASYAVSLPIGIATTVAVLLHEIPQEIADFGLLLHAGYTKARALMLNFISALMALLGAALYLVVGASIEGIEPIAAAFTAGAFIYIAAADLVPELHETTHPGRSFMQFAAMLVGIAAMFALLLLE